MITHGWKSGKEHRIEIWYVEHDKKYYIISERLEGAHWVQNIKHDSRVSFSTRDNHVFNGIARIVDREKDSGLAEEISKLMNVKYKWNEGLIVELTPTNPK